MTNAFSTRRQNKDKVEDLRRSIQHVLDQMSNLHFETAQQYCEYLHQLKKILPVKEAFALPAEVIAARLSDDEAEQRSICASLRGLARAAENKRLGMEWNKNHPEGYDTRANDFSVLPALKTSKRATTRHFAELDDEDKPIRKWDVKTTTTNYYLDQKKGQCPSRGLRWRPPKHFL